MGSTSPLRTSSAWAVASRFLKSLGMAPQFANGGHGGEVVLGIIGIIIVLVAGAIWRKRKLQGAEHSATA